MPLTHIKNNIFSRRGSKAQGPLGLAFGLSAWLPKVEPERSLYALGALACLFLGLAGCTNIPAQLEENSSVPAGKADDIICSVYAWSSTTDLNNDGQLDGTHDEPYLTIAQALGAISAGGPYSGCNEVVLLPGTYQEQLSYSGRAIIIRSESGPAQTILEPYEEAEGPLVTFDHDETPESVLRGLTLRNGKAERGGAIFIQDASPTIEDCVLENNHATRSGGAVFAQNYQGTFQRNELRGNSARNMGGGMALDADGFQIRDSSGAMIVDNRFSENEAPYGGAVGISGERIFNGTSRIDQVHTLARNRFLDNRGQTGSGFYGCVGTRATLWSNVFRRHTGSTIYLENAAMAAGTSIVFVNNTVVDSEDHAVSFGWSTASIFVNNQFVTAGKSMIVAGNGGTIVATDFRRNNFWDAPNYGVSNLGNTRAAEKNTYVNPGFSPGTIDPAFPGPTIDLGIDPAPWGVTADINGEPRRKGAGWDIGAFETWGLPTRCEENPGDEGCPVSCPVIVEASDTPGGKGTAQEPYPDILHGMKLRPPACDQVLVRPGIYTHRLDFGDDDVSVKSTEGPLVTIIQPAIPHGHAVNIAGGQTQAALLEGFTVRATAPRDADLFIKDSSPVLRGNIFDRLALGELSKCLYLEGFDGRFEGNTVRNCDSKNYYPYVMELKDSDGAIRDNRFSDNRVSVLTIRGGAPMVARNTFTNNSRSDRDIYALILSVTDAEVKNNLFVDNLGTAITLYPGSSSNADTPLVVNNTILGGRVGIHTDHGNRARFVNNVIAYQVDLGVRLIGVNGEWRHNLVFAPHNGWGNTSLVENWEDTNIIGEDPLLDPTTSTPLFGSPCLDSGRADLAPPEDLYGTARPQGNGVDLGAVETLFN